MKKIVQYMLHGSEIPYFIEDGGYFAQNGTMIGITKKSSKCHIPKTTKKSGDLTEFTNQEFIDFVKALPSLEYKGSLLTIEQKEQLASAWLLEKGLI